MTASDFSELTERSVELGPLKRDPAERDSSQNWQLARDEQGVAWLLMDKRDSSVNVLSEDVLTELDQLLDVLQRNLPRALVVRSIKPGGFCAGADISEFERAEDQQQVQEKLRDAHAVAQKLADLPCPTIAVVHGQTLGGGLELALCCDYRLAISGAVLGTPEVARR